MAAEDTGTPQGGDPGTTADTDQGSTANSGPSAEDIAALTKKVAELEADNKKYRDQRRTHEEQRTKEEQAAAAAKLTAEERTAKKIADLEKKVADAQRSAQDKATRAALLSAATKAKATNPDDIYRLVDHAGLEFDDDGNVTNADELVDELKKARPMYFAGAGSYDGGARTTQAPGLDMNQALRKAAGRA